MLNKDKPLNIQFLAIALLFLILPVASYAKVDINTMLNALSNNAGPIIRLVVAIAYVMGLWFIISSIMALKLIGQSQGMQTHQGLAGPLVKFIVGLLLLYLPSTIDIGVWTLWSHTALGSEAQSLMEYAPSPSDPFGALKKGSITIVRIVGYASFVRGLVILSHSADQGAQQGSVGKGILHVIGGILAINVVETIRVISNTLGITSSI